MRPSLSNIINFLNRSAPKGVIDCAASWVEEQIKKGDPFAPQPAAWWKGFADAREMIFHDPQLGAPADYVELPNVRWTISPESKLFYIAGARILGAEGAVISPDNRVFREFTLPPGNGSGWLDHSCFKRRKIPKIEELNGWYATVTYPNSKSYFHWMLESLPRMKFLAEYVCILDGVIVPEDYLPFHEQSLGALGIPRGKLVPVGPNSHYKVRHLFVPKYFALFNPPDWLHRWFKAAFLKAKLSTLKQKEKRIYLSRADASVRRVINEPDVISVLQSLDFEIFTLTDMPFLDQAQLLFEADVVVSPHGAALANLVFCRPGVQMMEIFTPNWMPPCYYALARAGKLKYAYMVATQVGKRAQIADMIIPIDVLRSNILRLIS